MVTDAGTAMGQDGQATAEALHSNEAAGIDPERLEICLSVLAEAEELSSKHPDSLVLQRATAKLFKALKVRRRRERRVAEQAADRAVIAKTATGAPNRTDDETRGIPLASSSADWTAGVFQRARPCYICKEKYRVVHAHYHQLCPTCAEENWARREARTDLTGRRALLTGGRAKIGMYIALRLLRDGAHTTITTRFPKDAVRRFSAMPDSADWLHRLRVVGLDLRDPAQVIALADSVGEQGPLDILINNAAQTVRRSPGSYARLIEAESAELPSGPLPEMVTFGSVGGRGAVDAIVSGAGERELTEGSPDHRQAAGPGTSAPLTPEALAALALTSGSAAADRIAAGNAIDAGGLVPDLVSENSWTQHVHEVDALEMLEVQLCNVTAPFLLVSRLRPAMATSSSRRKYIVNVSAMEGVFGRGYKGAGHPHTNMAKASLNMLTRTSAQEMLESDGILMTSVDTGWITDERPHPDKVRLAEAGFHAPLDLVDGAARVYDPIVRGERGEDVYGCFLKDYRPAAW
ncbi:SDR family NAD(P)-dependent oxidoreductase [Nocardiopsis rhodophaea]|uniref:SDR family NAD(P)-dependent oxidoreductase n=2 Tax=Nocardiopsis rhodophaea TaxID=280238 RepID=A0ABN2T861_9ACTN